MKTCSRCPNEFEPIRPFQRICSRCAIINLAEFIEERSPDDTIADISSAEQTGARLRTLVAKSKR